jgi:putative membrane-bound dehydrogenase-like protein
LIWGGGFGYLNGAMSAVKFCLALAGGLFLSFCVWGAPPEVDAAAELPRFPAVEASNAVNTLRLREGFHAELVAAEPLIQSPVAACFDENGRMFVAEMIGYSERFNESVDRIVMLEDTNGDGVYDKATVFADGLLWPTGLIWANGGLYAATTPNLYFFEDTTGSGKANVKKIIYSGFGFGGARKVRDMRDINVQGVVNSLEWGLDNKIHGATGPNGGMVTNLAVPSEPPLDLDGRNFAFDPRTLWLEAEEGGGQYGMSFDSRGRKFTCSNSDHIDAFMYESRYGGRNPWFAMPPAMVSIAADGAAGEVFRISPEEPWRVLRTQWRVAGLASGPVEGGGRSSGYFTGASGLTIYRGNAFPPEFLDNSFVGEVAFNLVHRDVITEHDGQLAANRALDETNREFLASTDTWFRPVDFANAPDGTLYVIDMHREIIEHPWSLPEQLKKHLDLNSGNDRGRIFRIAPDGFKEPPPPRLGTATTRELVALLDHPNGWHRDTAQRLLWERQDKSAIGPLWQMLTNGSRFGRLHALHALDGLGALKNKQIPMGNDPDWTVRAHELALQNILPRVQAAASDPSPEVRRQLAFNVGNGRGLPMYYLASVLKKDPDDPWLRMAAMSSLRVGGGKLFEMLSSDSEFRARPSGQEFLRELVELIGAQNDSPGVSNVFRFIASNNNLAVSFALAGSLGNGLKRAGKSLAGGQLDALFDRARAAAADGSPPEALRVSAIELLGSTDYEQSGAGLLALLNSNQPAAVQLAAAGTLAKFSATNVGPELARRLPDYVPAVRTDVIETLLARPGRAMALLAAIEAGTLPMHELTTAQITFLRSHRDAGVKAAARRILGPPAGANLQQVIARYLPALALKGTAAHGREIYLQRCSLCHRLGGAGHEVGPDLVTVKSSGKEKILINILDPNREVAPQYQAYEVDLKDGDSLVGLIVNETANSLTVRQPYGKEQVALLSNVARKKCQNQSLMPEGLEAGLEPRDFADLLEYISTADNK